MNKRSLNNLFVVICFLVITGLILNNVSKSRSLNRDNRFTIGRITKIEPNMNSGYRIYFEYHVMGKRYEPFSGIYKDKKKNSLIGKYFYVKFSPKNPKNCNLLLEEPVQNNFKNPPPNGWTEIPQ